MDIRKIIRDIIKEEYQTEFGDKDKARRGLIALSKGLITGDHLKYLKGSLGDADLDETGSKSSDGEVEIFYIFEDVEYSVTLNVTGEFYFTKGSSGHWGSSIDDSQAPDPDDYEDEEVLLNDEEIILSDDDDNEFEFHVSELGPDFVKNMEEFLTNYYDAYDNELSKN